MAANVKFKKGAQSQLPAAADGQILFAIDTGNLYIDDGSTHVRVNAGHADTAGSATTAATAGALESKNIGSANTPVFINSEGKPVAINFSIEKSVPSNAKFTDTTYSTATTSRNGLMTKAMVTKLNGIEEGANKTIVDTTLSDSSTNPVENKAVASAITNLGTQIETEFDKAITGLSVSGKVITYTKGDGSTGTITTQDTNTTYSDMTGASSSAAGKHGLVPAPAAGKQSSFLRGDGQWVVPTDTNTTYDVFVKSGSGAKEGLVPKPSTTAGTTKYLREDGTWQVPPDNNTTYSNMTGASSSAAGKAGLVPAPAAGKQSSFLRGDGTWVVPTNTTYSAGTGISLSGTTFSNSGVRSIATGSANGTISVNTNGTSADVAVKGLGSAAYKNTSAFDAAGAAEDALEEAKSYADTVGETRAKKAAGVYYIEGQGTTDTTNKVATWLGTHADISAYYEGLMVAYKVGTDGSTTTTLNINNLGAIPVVKNADTGITTSFPVNSVILLVYTLDGTTARWKAHDYDTNTKTTAGSSNKASTKLFLIGAASQASSNTTYSNSSIYINTSNQLYSASGFSGDLKGNADTATKASQDASGNVISTTYETKTAANEKLEAAKTYAEEQASAAATAVKNELLNGAGAAYDTLKELGDLIVANDSAIDALETVASGKQDKITGAATTIVADNLTASRVLVSNSSGKVAASSAITTTELGYLDGVSSKIQPQLDGKSSSTHTHTATYTPTGTVSKPTFTGSSATTAKPDTTNVTSVATGNHTHSVTAAGTVAATFTGTAASIAKTSTTGTQVGSSTHTHTYAPSGDVAATFTGTAATIAKTGTTGTKVASSTHTHTVTAAGALTGTVADRTLTLGISFSAVTSDGPSATATVANNSHTHSYTPAGTVAATFTGVADVTGQPSATSTVAAQAHTHPSITPAGTISAAFTGTAVTSGAASGTASLPNANHTHTVTAKGSVSQPTFTGDAATITTSVPG